MQFVFKTNNLAKSKLYKEFFIYTKQKTYVEKFLTGNDFSLKGN